MPDADTPEPPLRPVDPPPRSSSWQRTLAVMIASQVLTQVAFTLVLPFLPLYILKLGVHSAAQAALWAGVSSTASGLAMAAFSPLWGRLADRYGRKSMVLRATFGGVVIVGAMGLVGGPLPLVILRLIQGAVTGTVAASNTLVAATVPPRRLGFSMGLMQTAVLVGASGGPLLGGVLADHLGFRMTFAVTAALLLLAGLLVTFGAREGARPLVRARVDRARPDVKALSPVIVVSFLDQFANSIASPILPLFIATLAVGSGASTSTGFVLGSVALSASLGSLIAGRLADQPLWLPSIGRPRAGAGAGRGGYRLAPSPRTLLVVCALGAAVFTLTQAFVHSVPALAAARMLMGLFIGGTIPASNVVLGALTRPETRGAAFGLTSSASALGFAAGPLVGALLLAYSVRLPFVITAVMLAAQALWVYRQIPRRLPETL